MAHTIISLLNKAFSDFSENTALICSDGTKLSYQQVRERASRLATYLSKKGVEDGSLVAVLMDRSTDYVIATVACMLFGYGFIPMDTSYSKERIDMIVKDSNPSFVITESDFVNSINEEPMQKVNYDIPQDNPAFMVFTSGSTGKPKGIVHDQLSFVSAVERNRDANRLTKGDIWGSTAPFTFVAFLLDVPTVFASGSALTLIPRDIVKDPELLSSYISEKGITGAIIPPRVLKFFKKTGDSLRLVITGTEKVCDVKPSNYRLISVYGQSESCGPCVLQEVDKPYEVVPVGKPLGSVALYVLDDNDKEVEEGEICLSGHFMTGYLNLNEQTENVLKKNPFQDRDGNEQILHTGDLGKRLPNGDVLYLNRKDWMIKINGQRVEPGEIESVIKKIEGITDAAVKSFENRYGQTYICAYYSARTEINSDVIRCYLQERLPSYMVPSFFVQLDELPLNNNRKLDRKALREPDASNFLAEYEQPESKTEIILCKAFEKILGLTKIGANDDFFKLGGDSIKAVMVVNECASLGLSVRHIYSGKTPRNIAKEASKYTSTLLSVDESIREMPLSDSQMGIYLDTDLDRPSIKYNIPFVLTYSREKYDACSVKSALEKTFLFHQAFSLTVNVDQGKPVMSKTDKIPEIEVVEASESEYEEIKKSFVQPFAFNGKPLCRAKIVQTDHYIYLMLDIYHLFFDGTSMGVFKDTINDFLEGRAPDPEIVTPFMVSSSDKTNKGSETEKESLEYFKNLLSDCTADSNLIPDVYRPEFGNACGVVSSTIINDVASIDYFAKTRSVSENIIFAGAYAMALAKFTGQPESLFVSVENGRHQAGMERSIGMFVRSFPVFISVDENLGTSEYLYSVQKSFYDAMSHDTASFVDVVNECGIDSSVKFVYQSELLRGAEVLPVPEALSNLDMMVFKQNGGYKVTVSYKKSMYSEELIQSFVQSYCSIVDGFVNGSSLREINLISPEQETLLDSFNNTEKDYDKTENVVDVFKKQVALYPDHIAVSYNKKTITYAEFDDLSDRIAFNLITRGVVKNDKVPVLAGRSQYLPVLVWGVIKSGAVCQPLDPSYPIDRLNFMVQDSCAKLVIADKQYASVLSDFTGEYLFTEEVAKLPHSDINFDKISPENGLALLYTSGTTGLPKGFVLSHKNIRAFVFSHEKVMELDSNSQYASYAGFGFDACLMDIVSIPMAGGALHIVPEEIRLDLKALCKFYVDNKITHGFITTLLGCMFAQVVDSPYLKAFMVGGEKLVPFKPCGKFRVINGYGPSECMAYVTHFDVKDDSLIQPIGKPSLNTKIYVTDSYGRRLPVGACGELLISTLQSTQGYINRPEATKKSFIDNSFCDLPEYNRIYKTGDIVRFLTDGNVEFVGRRDGQVKVRGYRIELTEIDQVIRFFPDIKQETVQAFDDPSGGKFIAAYITSDKKINIDELNDFIASQKPEYMVPAVTMQIDSIPVTPNGKVDKKKLPNPEYKPEEIVAPVNDVQKEILEAVFSICGNKNIGITSNIFRAGLTSIGVIRLNAYLADTYGVVVQSKDIKNNPTVEMLESFVSSAEKVEESKIVSLQDYPLTKTQEGILLECQSDPKSTVYNIPYLLKISKDIDIDKLKIAICEAVEAHRYINTSLFFDNDGNIRQRVAPVGSYNVNNIETIYAETLDDIRETLVQPHQLVGGRLFRICIIEADERYLFMDFHHIISDGTSMNVFVSDIEQAYKGIAPAEEKFTGFDIALSEQKARNSHAYLDAEEYYQNLLAGIDTEFLPHSDMHCYAKNGRGKLIVQGHVGSPENISLYCKKYHVSENSVLCTAFGYVLASYNGTDSSLFTTVYNGRNDSRMGRTVSMLVKTLPVLFNPENDDVKTVVNRMSNQLVDSMANDVYSFAEISRQFGVKTDVMFIFQGKGFEQNTFCSKECEPVSLGLNDEKAPISIQVVQKDDYYEYEIDFDGTRFTDDFANCLIRAIDETVLQISEVNKFEDIFLVDDSTVLLLDKINATEVPFDRKKNVVVKLKEHANLMPEFPAVKYLDRTYSYKEFDRITDNLASYLSSFGACRNSFVAILIDRSQYMAITSWGVVKSGAAYLPIDASYPKERIEMMLEDSGAKILITERNKESLFNGFTGKVIYTDEIESLPDVGTFETKIDEEDSVILIYSSGSTGKPKGSILPHRSINALISHYVKTHDMNPRDSIANYASFGFDAGFMDIFTCLSSGMTLCIIPEEIRLDLPAIEQFFIDNSINHSFMTTQVARPFLQNTKCKTLKSFLFGGEKMVSFTPPEDIKVFNGYGPSETDCYVTCFRVLDNSSVQPIGKQVENTKLYVVDKGGKRLPPYACGELCIAGPQVALGYLNRPEKSALSFVKNPFCDDKDYSIMYKTGDIVRMFADGNYDFVGRRDGQVKVRGFRIELGEIEHIISEFESVKQVTAQAFDDANGGKFVAAYIVADSKIDSDEIAAFIRKSKPSYMVPSFMTQIDAIPLTSNGKVNKSKLPAPKLSSVRTGLEPEGEVEKRLCSIFASILNVDKVYADDDFFEIGGTSILALQLVVKCVNDGFPIVYKNIFENPTPRALAKLSQGEKKSKDYFAPSGDEASKFNYSALDFNTVENLDKIKTSDIGDVLLTGATGFLGIHVLYTLLKETQGKVICLIRHNSKLSSESRLKLYAEYYFSDPLEEYFGSRIFIVDSSLSDSSLSEKLGDYSFDTIINCAANVRHFGSEEALMRDNFEGISRLISIAKSRNARLVQTSSVSVCGESVNGHIDPKTIFRENDLNIGQSLENMYVRSKYLAEQEIIDACSKGLRGKVVRFGNLMARDIDGEFQINASNNGFLRILNAYRILGCFPVEALDTPIEFSPIECAAKALILLAGTPDEFTVFHCNNAHSVHMANIFENMNAIGLSVKQVSSEEFRNRFSEASKDEAMTQKLSGLISYRNSSSDDASSSLSKGNNVKLENLNYRVKIATDNSYTVKALYRLGFSWPLTDNDYLVQLFKKLQGLDFFN